MDRSACRRHRPSEQAEGRLLGGLGTATETLAQRRVFWKLSPKSLTPGRSGRLYDGLL